MEDLAEDRTFIYRIDAENHITYVNREWVDFAKENQAPELTQGDVLGQPIEGFISGWETRHLYEIIFEKVRQSGREIKIPFRCDSPNQGRYFQMRITAAAGGALDFTVNVIRIEPRPSRPLLDNSIEHSSTVVVICSWCKRILIDDSRWVDIENATGRQELFGATPPTLTHDVCPDCLSAIYRQLDDR